MVSPRNEEPELDFRSIKDDAWYTVDKLVLSNKNTTLTVRFLDFGRGDDEVFQVKDFKSAEEIDEFVERFRPACVQLQDEECKDLRRFTLVCALLERGEDDKKWFNGFIESIHRQPHTQKGGEESCSCQFVVGWTEGPKFKETEQMPLERICKIQEGSPLFDNALAYFVNMSKARLDSD